MESNKVCSNCGMVNNATSCFCSNCGIQLIQNNKVVNEQNSVGQNTNNIEGLNGQINNNNSEGNKLGVISLILYFAGSIIVSAISYLLPISIRYYFSSLSGLFPLAGIVVMIVGRVKYPTNKLLKVVMWVIIGSIIFCLVAFALFCIWCYVTCSSMDTSGCS